MYSTEIQQINEDPQNAPTSPAKVWLTRIVLQICQHFTKVNKVLTAGSQVSATIFSVVFDMEQGTP